VVMDPLTGRVYSIVNQEWALRRGFKPCSTIKLVTGVAGLSENAVPLFDTANDGFRLDLTSALAHSDNPFFQQVGARIGGEKMVKYARELGLGEKTGINVPFEFPGKLPEVKPDVVLEVAFNSIQPSTRHASGLALRFPRIKAIRRDKTIKNIDTLAYAQQLAAEQNRKQSP